MNCREFKDKFEDGLKLSEKANAHLKSCADCEIFQSENVQLTQMISSLQNIEAPKDFEFGFKAKLANAQLKRPLSPIWQALRFALPLTAAALIFGIVFVNSNLFTTTEAPQIVEQKEPLEQKEVPVGGNNEIQEPTSEIVAESSGTNDEQKASEKIENSKTTQDTKIPADIVAENKPKVNDKNESEIEKVFTLDIKPDERPKVLDEALTIPESINPPGIDPDKEIDPTQMQQPTTSFTAKQILSQLGIETSDRGGQLKVNSVRQNSVGENSGVRVGDIITAIDGEKLSNKPMQNRTVQGKTLKLKRGDKDIEITIRNN